MKINCAQNNSLNIITKTDVSEMSQPILKYLSRVRNQKPEMSAGLTAALVVHVCHCQMASPGNWMHLQYQSRLQARKALSKDGKVFGDAIMVGVKPCIDKVGSDAHAALASCLLGGDVHTHVCSLPPLITHLSSVECDGQQQHRSRSLLPSAHPLLGAALHPSLSHETSRCGLQRELWERLPGSALFTQES